MLPQRQERCPLRSTACFATEHLMHGGTAWIDLSVLLYPLLPIAVILSCLCCHLLSALSHAPACNILVHGRWLRKEKQRKLAERGTDQGSSEPSPASLPQWSNGYTSGRLTSSLKNSSNAVMRM